MCIRDRYQRRVHGCIKNKIIRITVIIKCLSQETQMADQILSKLQITIDNLRYQQQVLLSEVAEEKVQLNDMVIAVSYTHLRAHETRHDLVCRLLLEKKKKKGKTKEQEKRNRKKKKKNRK
eukprot:TRINITY_DN10000_c0_g1_i2.p3 TRINITY_DN10000_c0_g1~~TRINITY_DN10000_c0_g1_i2.p3  ORF type:complete len:121 (+),score=37.50 TRINITY_DN10000_c0_g1_i2:154-516(+)